MVDIEFKIDTDNQIIIRCRDDVNNLSRFSEASAYFVYKNQVISNLANDVFIELISPLNNTLLKAIEEESGLFITDSYFSNVGYKWNQWTYDLPEEWEGEEDIFNEFWIWSTKVTGTWLYRNADRDIVIEICPIYKWHFEDPDNEIDYVSFEEFIKYYKAILQKKLDIDLVKAWQNECQKYLKLIK
ncbi:hypothetical protein MM221_21145 [Salipaludibacillus sp. LMS25]|jgi:hypothetical protein|uniref:hypothetical protein n=1 Tax=Salipaludibacillus sp. LMS25 TaxID=2924031 RepID=UPI0020D1B28B|nr:hypothetical protein [Salipaludibacillus sp. LMS25]UTR15003.1 hypothetical protein MM221_21145 [Salipaludibacillus sp. LMS25]